MGLVARLRALVAPLTPLRAFIARGLRSIGLADVLVIGGGIAFTAGTVARYGWPVALMVVGAAATLGGIGVAIRESRRAGRR